MWHFLISLSLKCGLSAEDVYRIYLEKNRENHARQDGTRINEEYAVRGMTCDELREMGQPLVDGFTAGIDWANGTDSNGYLK
ncbi:hypothetical protein [Bacillus cereus]